MSQTTILVSSHTSFDLRGKSYLGNEVRNVNPKESPVIKRRSRKRVGECTTRSKSEIKDKLTAIFVGDLFLSQTYDCFYHVSNSDRDQKLSFKNFQTILRYKDLKFCFGYHLKLEDENGILRLI